MARVPGPNYRRARRKAWSPSGTTAIAGLSAPSAGRWLSPRPPGKASAIVVTNLTPTHPDSFGPTLQGLRPDLSSGNTLRRHASAYLDGLAAKHNVTWLGLFLVGSRARGMAGPDSDYDLVGWYTQSPVTYLTLGEPPLQTLGPRELRLTEAGLTDSLAVPGTKVEFFARDYRTVLALATKSNPHVLEIARLLDECVFLTTRDVSELLYALAQGRVEPRRLVYHYASLGHNMLTDFGRRGDAKALLHAAHALFGGRWAIMLRGAPPSAFASLLQLGTERYPQVSAHVRPMLAARRAGRTVEAMPPAIVAEMTREVDALREEAEFLPDGNPLTRDEGDALWRETLVEHYGRKCLVL